MVFGFLPNTCSIGLSLLAAAAVLRAINNRARPAFPRSMTIVVSAVNLPLCVLFKRSIFPFPRWSRTGHSMCLMKCSLQNGLNASPRNMVAGSVLILFGIQNWAMCAYKKFYYGFCSQFSYKCGNGRLASSFCDQLSLTGISLP